MSDARIVPSEAIGSLVDAGNDVLLLYGMRCSDARLAMLTACSTFELSKPNERG